MTQSPTIKTNYGTSLSNYGRARSETPPAPVRSATPTQSQPVSTPPPRTVVQSRVRPSLTQGALNARPSLLSPQRPRQAFPVAPQAPRFDSVNARYQQRVTQILDSARAELAGFASGEYRERNNRGDRIDLYARTARFGNSHDTSEKGRDWCGFFAGYNYAQAGFTRHGGLHGVAKASYFFMYRSFTSKEPGNARQAGEADRELHGQHGRQFFFFEDSQGPEFIRRNHRRFDVDADDYIQSNSYDLDRLPAQGGDILLFKGHVALVESYDPVTHIVTTIEGNIRGGVRRVQHDLNNPRVRRRVIGIGRPSPFDFQDSTP